MLNESQIIMKLATANSSIAAAWDSTAFMCQKAKYGKWEAII